MLKNINKELNISELIFGDGKIFDDDENFKIQCLKIEL